MPKIEILEILDPIGARSARNWMTFICSENRQGTVSTLKLRLEYISPGRHPVREVPTNLCASYCQRSERFSISRADPSCGSGGWVCIEPGFMRGKRLGSFLMWHVVTWGQKHCPDYLVNHVWLNNKQDPKEILIRDRLYTGMGLPLDSETEQVRVKALVAPTSWNNNITVHSHNGWLNDALVTKADLMQAKIDLEAVRACLKDYRDRGFWARILG